MKRKLTEREIGILLDTVDKARTMELDKGNWQNTYCVEASFRLGREWMPFGKIPLDGFMFRNAYIKTSKGNTYIYRDDERYLIDESIKALFEEDF